MKTEALLIIINLVLFDRPAYCEALAQQCRFNQTPYCVAIKEKQSPEQAKSDSDFWNEFCVS